MNLDEFLRREPISDRGISVVIPSHNAEATIEQDVGGVVQFVEGIGRGYEIIVSDYGSSDATATIATRLAESNRRVRVLVHCEGYGAALRGGFSEAKYPLVLQWDAGAQFDPSETARLLEAIDQVDIVCGFRARNMPPMPNGMWYRWLLRWVFAVRMRDVDCGFKLFRRAALRRIPIQAVGRFASAEILAKATFMNMLVGEVAVTSRDDGRSRPPLEPMTRTFTEAFQVFRRPQFTVNDRL